MKIEKIVCFIIGYVICVLANDNTFILQNEPVLKLNITQAIQRALANNPELKAKKSDIQSQEQKLAIAQSSNLPIIGLEASLSRYNHDQRLIAATYNGEKGEFGNNILQSNLILKIPLYAGGRIVANIEANEYLKLAQEHLLSFSKNELIYNIRLLFWSIYAQKKTIDSLLFAIETMQKHQKEVNLRFELKDAAKVDILKTEVRIADLKQRLENEKSKFSSLYSLLYSTIGVVNHSTENNMKIDLKEMNARLNHAFIIPKNIYKVALQKREDYLSLKAKEKALKKEIIVAQASYKPTVGLYGNYGYRNLTDTANTDEVSRSVGIAFSLPLYSGGANEAKVALSYANLRSAQERLHSLELKIQNQINNALNEFSSARKRAKLSKDAIDLALENLRVEELKYSLGKGSQIDLLDAQSVLLNTQTNYAKMVSSEHIAQAKLFYSIGENYFNPNKNTRNENVQ